MRKAKDVDEYIASAPKEARSKLKEMRKIIKEVAPKAEEKISYGMPYYGYHGRLAYFAWFKDHVSLFAMPPIPDAYKKKLNVTGKSTIQFSFDQKLPSALIRKLVKERAKKNETNRANGTVGREKRTKSDKAQRQSDGLEKKLERRPAQVPKKKAA